VTRFAPVRPEKLAASLAAEFDRRHRGAHPLRIALHAPELAGASDLLPELRDRLGTAGRPTATIAAAWFYRDASLRLEYGRTDVESFYSGWLDTAALQREVLQPLGQPEAWYLPSLRDPVTNRATRAERAPLASAGVAVVSGEMLLGAGLSFDLTVHVSVSRQARKRRVPPDREWTLPAFDRYDLDVDPSGSADVVIRWDDRNHPAMLIR